MRISTPSFRLKNCQTLCLARSGEILVTAGARIYVWSIANRELISKFKVISNEHHLALSPDENVLAIKNANGELAFCETRTGKLISQTGEFRQYRAGCAPHFSPDGNYLYDGDWNGDLHVWRVRDAKLVDSLSYADHMIHSICVSPDANKYAAAIHAKYLEPGGTKIQIFDGEFIAKRPTLLEPAEKSDSHDGGWRDTHHMHFDPEDGSLIIVLDNVVGSDSTRFVRVPAEGQGGCVEKDMEDSYQSVTSMSLGKEVIAAVVKTNIYRQGMSSQEYQALHANTEMEHLWFLNRETFEPIAVRHWHEAANVAINREINGIAVASHAGSAYIADFDGTIERTRELFG